MNELIIHAERCMPIQNFNRYVVSDGGRIYRVAPINNKEVEAREKNPDILYFHEVKSKLQSRRGRHRRKVCGLFHNDGHYTCSSVSTLVAKAFGIYPKNPTFYQVEYADSNPENCSLGNIYYIQRQPANQILTIEDVEKIRKLIAHGVPLRHIAESFGVCEMQVGRIKTGENWNNGRRIIKAPTTPIKIKHGRIRRFLATCESTKLGKDIPNQPFTIRRDPNDPANNILSGIIRGYKFSKKIANISRARVIIFKMNKHFFGTPIAERYEQNVLKKLDHKNIKPLESLALMRR